MTARPSCRPPNDRIISCCGYDRWTFVVVYAFQSQRTGWYGENIPQFCPVSHSLLFRCCNCYWSVTEVQFLFRFPKLYCMLTSNYKKKLPTPFHPGPSNHLPSQHHVSVNTLEDPKPAPLPHQPNPLQQFVTELVRGEPSNHHATPGTVCQTSSLSNWFLKDEGPHKINRFTFCHHSMKIQCKAQLLSFVWWWCLFHGVHVST